LQQAEGEIALTAPASRLRYWINRILVKVSSVLIERFSLPARMTGFVFLRTTSIRRILEDGRVINRIQVLEPCDSFAVGSAAALAVVDGGFRARAVAVPEIGSSRKVSAASVVRIGGCQVASFRDRWNNDFSIVLDRDDRLVVLPRTEVNGGKGWDCFAGHSRVLRRDTFVKVGCVLWIAENWSFNYYHWFVYHLPKLLLLDHQYPEWPLLLPARRFYPRYAIDSLRMIGFDDSRLLEPETDRVFVGELAVAEMDSYDPRLLTRLARKLAGEPRRDSPPRLFVTRRRAERRRVDNEKSVDTLLVDYGFVTVETEGLSLAQQIELFACAQIIVGQHGAGLTNMLFAPQGAYVIEFTNPTYAADHYAQLAESLGHRYAALVSADSGDQTAALYRNIVVPINELKRIVEHIVGAAGSNADIG